LTLPIDSAAPGANLAQLDDKWTRASVSPDEMYSDIPDGRYEAVIEDARIVETSPSGRLVLVWRMRIQGPHSANRVVTKSRVIAEHTLGFLREDLANCRLYISRLSDLPGRLRELAYRQVGLEKLTRNGEVHFLLLLANRSKHPNWPAR